MTGFNGIFAGIYIQQKPKFSVLSMSGGEKRLGGGAAKIYLALLQAELFEVFKSGKRVKVASKTEDARVCKIVALIFR